jgi:hypothetical protein
LAQNQLFEQIPLGRMPSLTAASLLLESGALMLSLRATKFSNRAGAALRLRERDGERIELGPPAR